MISFNKHPFLRATIGVVCATTFSASHAAALSYFEDWNNGALNDWTGNTIHSAVGNPGVGGNPGGYLQSTRTGAFSIGAATQAPAATDNFVGGLWTASFDLRQEVGTVSDFYLRFRYQDSTFNGWRYRFNEPVNANWQTYLIVFDPNWTDAQASLAGWTTDLPGGFASVSWAQTMSDVYTTEVRVDGSSTLAIGLDNFRLTGPRNDLPLPSSLVLVALGALAFGARRARKQV